MRNWRCMIGWHRWIRKENIRTYTVFCQRCYYIKLIWDKVNDVEKWVSNQSHQ